ncbi:tRNA (adenosine(37)-N6)-dimethylallyltransferase MiaA [Waterburya agarophytonicola K14]|uniref:tRNA dimethylallyltransferase n=1 Tax=Waterburya agarophytonicola KI4 TaxID=2874699 RepID=A0A964FG25_9CYAN|nr:tRNA (adenosine(37)-N6)-dimethylallyltransferase MiaA [Waterburya agarophytonicola]MCC0178495.1 tRNA (adenosine(37)-N6)-dimethylallyltransferase MiaA [Waterburya agarophytonicola KI4]
MLIVICGATASGKSSLALEIARRLDSIIISADSRQIYCEFDIGTAKPSSKEQQLVDHYQIDICEPTETLTLAEYQQQTQAIIEDRLDRPLLLVGGTGLYLDSITKGLKIPRVSPQPELRSQLSAIGQIQAHSWLSQVDPKAAQKIHINDQFRTLRALEVFYTTGIPISEQQGENPPNYPILQIGLDCDVPASDQRIATRTHQMIEMGLVNEVKYLCQKYGADLPLLNTLGYGEIKQYLAGEIDLNEAIALTITHTRQFAKRQRTWFQKNKQINWFDNSREDLPERVWHKIQEFI